MKEVPYLSAQSVHFLLKRYKYEAARYLVFIVDNCNCGLPAISWLQVLELCVILSFVHDN